MLKAKERGQSSCRDILGWAFYPLLRRCVRRGSSCWKPAQIHDPDGIRRDCHQSKALDYHHIALDWLAWEFPSWPISRRPSVPERDQVWFQADQEWYPWFRGRRKGRRRLAVWRHTSGEGIAPTRWGRHAWWSNHQLHSEGDRDPRVLSVSLIVACLKDVHFGKLSLQSIDGQSCRWCKYDE